MQKKGVEKEWHKGKKEVAINQRVEKKGGKKAKKSFVSKKKCVLLHSQNDGTVTLKEEREENGKRG